MTLKANKDVILISETSQFFTGRTRILQGFNYQS